MKTNAVTERLKNLEAQEVKRLESVIRHEFYSIWQSIGSDYLQGSESSSIPRREVIEIVADRTYQAWDNLQYGSESDKADAPVAKAYWESLDRKAQDRIFKATFTSARYGL
jgi:hypothetical protein